MKRILSHFICCLLLFFSYLIPSQAAETYILDPMHTYVAWHVSHFGFSRPSGKWLAEGTLLLDEQKPQNSKVDVTIKVSDLITGIPKLDEHLKSKDFFDVEQFPTATFVSDKVDVTGKKTATVYGMLTLHGVSKPVVLHVILNKMDISPISNKKTVGFSATAEIKRSDFGMNAYLPGVGNEVKLDIEAEGQLKN